MTTAVLETVDTPDGPFTMLATDDGTVLSSGWTVDADAIVTRIRPSDRPNDVRAGATGHAGAVAAYYSGDTVPAMEVPVRQFGTALQLRGWRALRDIPPGAPLTYTQFAEMLRSPAAVRAAAGICARNAPALFVPCHRVLRTDGSMGGFAWGTPIKRSLLAREGDGLF